MLLRIGRRAAEEGELEAARPWRVCGVKFGGVGGGGGGEVRGAVRCLFTPLYCDLWEHFFYVEVIGGKVDAGSFVCCC